MTTPKAQKSTPRIVVVVVALVALAEAGIIGLQHSKLTSVMKRLEDIHTMEALELDSRLSLLVMLDEEQAGLRFEDLRATQRDASHWLEDYLVRHSIDGEQATLLRGILAAYLSDYAAARVATAVRADPNRPAMGEAAETERFFRAIHHVLGTADGDIFQAEISYAWQTWGQSPQGSP